MSSYAPKAEQLPPAYRVRQWKQWHANGRSVEDIARHVRRTPATIQRALFKKPTPAAEAAELATTWSALFSEGFTSEYLAKEYGFSASVIKTHMARVRARVASRLDGTSAVERWRKDGRTLKYFCRLNQLPIWWLKHHAGIKLWRHYDRVQARLLRGVHPAQIARDLRMGSQNLKNRIVAFNLEAPNG